MGARAGGSRDLLQRALRPGGKDERIAAARELGGHGRTNAGACAGDNDDSIHAAIVLARRKAAPYTVCRAALYAPPSSVVLPIKFAAAIAAARTSRRSSRRGSL